MSDFQDLDPNLLRELETQSCTRQKRMVALLTKYRAFGYFFYSDELVEGDVVRIDLPGAVIEGMAATSAPRTLAGEVTPAARALQIEYDTAPKEMNLVGESIIPGGWGNLNLTGRGGYFPQMFSHGFVFGYHILGEGRANAESLLVPYAHLEVNGTTFFDSGE